MATKPTKSLTPDEIRAQFRALAKQAQPAVLSPAEKARLSEINLKLLTQQPFFSSLVLGECEVIATRAPGIWQPGADVAATDGRTIFVNPDTLLKMPMQEGVFVICHEVLHVVLNHPVMFYGYRLTGRVPFNDGTFLPYDHQTMNESADAIINAVLIADKVGVPPQGVVQLSWVSPDMSTLDVYRLLYEEKQKQNGQGKGGGAGAGSGRNPNGKSFDQVTDPGAMSGKDPAQAAQDEAQRAPEKAMNLQAATDRARIQGNMPSNLQRLVGEAIEPPVDWRDHLASTLARAAGGGGWDFQRGDPRFLVRQDPVFIPSRSGKGTGVVVVAVDTSGSIGDKEVDLFFAALSGMIADCKPSCVHVLWCDAKIHRHDIVEDATDLPELRKAGAPGGGGTSFIPVFDWVREQGMTPQSLVYFTDTYGSFPDVEPKYPVIWGTIERGEAWVPPFGTNVPVDI